MDERKVREALADLIAEASAITDAEGWVVGVFDPELEDGAQRGFTSVYVNDDGEMFKSALEAAMWAADADARWNDQAVDDPPIHHIVVPVFTNKKKGA